MRPYKPYIPQTMGELWDRIGSMVLNAPLFEDDTGMYPDKNIGTEFSSLNESLKLLRDKFGEQNYAAMLELSDRMRAHFEADPDSSNGETRKGRECLYAMEDIIRSVRKNGRR